MIFTLRNGLPDLSQRSSEPELMDNFDSDRDLLRETLVQFKMINHYLSGMVPCLKSGLLPYLRQNPGQKTTILDIGCGGCDIPIWLARYCLKKSLPVTIIGIDHDPRVVAYAQEACREYANIVIKCSSLDNFFSTSQKYDFVYANHFLHHLSPMEVAPAIYGIYQKSRAGFFINDIKRSLISYIGYKIITCFTFHHSFTSYDGLLSIRKGFTKSELKNIIYHLGINSSVTIRDNPPGHICISGFK